MIKPSSSDATKLLSISNEFDVKYWISTDFLIKLLSLSRTSGVTFTFNEVRTQFTKLNKKL